MVSCLHMIYLLYTNCGTQILCLLNTVTFSFFVMWGLPVNPMSGINQHVSSFNPHLARLS